MYIYYMVETICRALSPGQYHFRYCLAMSVINISEFSKFCMYIYFCNQESLNPPICSKIDTVNRFDSQVMTMPSFHLATKMLINIVDSASSMAITETKIIYVFLDPRHPSRRWIQETSRRIQGALRHTAGRGYSDGQGIQAQVPRFARLPCGLTV